MSKTTTNQQQPDFTYSYSFTHDGQGMRSGGQLLACDECKQPFTPGATVFVYYSPIRTGQRVSRQYVRQHWKCSACHALSAQQTTQQQTTQQTQMDARAARYDELAKRSKDDLLALFSRLRRVHALSTRDSKRDIICAILDVELPVRER